MRIQPDRQEAAEDQAAVIGLLRTVLSSVGSYFGIDDPVAQTFAAPEPDVLRYPGLVAAAYEAQRARQAARKGLDERRHLMTRVQAIVEQARSSARRAQDCACPTWRVDLAPPEPHLRASLARAVAQVPKPPDRLEALAKIAVADWQDEQREAFCVASCLLASIWPQMLAEMTAVVRQVALLRGYGIDGFTDFTAHGTVFVNSRRLGPGAGGLPADAHMAEALVHEATHNRCNAAAVSRPFLAGDDTSPESLVMTPLRSDPRPLAGLFQQLVVLVRCSLLYDRLVECATGDAHALRARRERLVGQARQGLATAQRHSGKLTEHGRAIVAEAADMLNREASAAPAH
ncbi:MAG: aKG-HExxH-type peptide beta-hydroxylase [Egibacteraceae bacterium]